MVIERFRKKYPQRREFVLDVIDALPVLRELFWNEAIGDAVAAILSHLRAARGARDRSLLLRGTDFMEDTLAALESGAKKALTERDDMLLFLAHYQPASA